MQTAQDITAGMSREQMAAAIASLMSENETLCKQVGVLSADNDSLAARNLEAAADIARLAGELRDAQAEVERLNELVRVMEEKLYGSSSEKGGFNDAEEGAAEKAREEARRPRKRGKRRDIDYSKYPNQVCDHRLAASELPCPRCGTARVEMGYESRWELRYIPGKLVAVEHRMWKYVCPECSRRRAEGADEDLPLEIERAHGPSMPLGKSHAGASLLALILHRKYRLSQPLYRIQGDLSESHGLQDGRNTLAGWVVSSWERWFSLLYGLMRSELLGRDLIHADETPVICIEQSREDRERKKSKKNSKGGSGRGKKAAGTTKSYMWLFCSAACDVPVYLYRFGPGRGREVPEDFLGPWRGTMVTDCYDVYTAMCSEEGRGLSRVACGVHIRRYFMEAATGAAKAGGRVYSAAVEGVERINEIFAVEDGIQEAHAGDWEKVAEERRRLLGPKLDSFSEWARDRLENYAAKGSRLEKALKYALKNWADFSRILEDGRFPLSNNRAEQAVRPFAVGRKNWLFCSSKSGAEASAGIYSVVATARANGLDDERYMEWVLTEMPKAQDAGELEERLADFLPWSDKVPESCRAGCRESAFEDEPVVDVDPAMFDRD